MMLRIYGRNGSRSRIKLRAGEISIKEFQALRMAVLSLHDSTNIEAMATPIVEGGAYLYLENGKYLLEARTEDDPRQMVLKFALREVNDEEFLIWLTDAIRIEVTNKVKGKVIKIAPTEYASLS